MKKIYFLILFVLGYTLNAQIVNIPDANFKAKLLSASPSNVVASTETSIYNPTFGTWSVSSYNFIDINGDGEIQFSEAQNIKRLNLNFSSINDLTGIEAFINLQFLTCSNNQLFFLDVTQNINLQYLNCSRNQLLSLDIAPNTILQDLDCSTNQLSSLDIATNMNLQYLNCSVNIISSLNLSSNTNLKFLNCSGNQLSGLNTLQNVNLKVINFENNFVINIDLLQNLFLDTLFCSDNLLTNIDLSQNFFLKKIVCNNNQLTILDLHQNVLLEYLSCNDNLLNTLELNSTAINSLYCDNNNLTSLFIKNNKGFNAIYGPNGGFTLSFDSNENLEYICTDDYKISLFEQKLQEYGNLNCHVNSYCSFTSGGTFYEISGNTKFDFNNNGCDVSDINCPNLKLSITDGTNTGSFIGNSTGDYYMPVQAGNHIITPILENPTYFNISPASFTVSFPAQASPFTQDFCVTANGSHSDVEVAVIPTLPARPGFDTNYRIIYKNIGNQVENGEIKFAYEEDVLDFISSSLIANSQNTLANTTTLSWNYSNLLPFETRTIDVFLNVNSPTETPAVNIGDVLGIFSEISTVNTDEDLSNNSSGLRQVVVGSYDPNDKTCLEGEYVSSSVVGKYVHYVIRFENTGTYPAENIVVKDMIDTSKFDISTLLPLHGSHEFYTRINGNKVEFIFENINLDFNNATNDGYIAFKIKTKNNLTVGQTFSNNASIYFDYNFPITTNTYTTTIDNLLNNQDFNFENEFVLYPNPTKDILNISAKNQKEIQSVEIYNLVGQVVIAIPNTTKTIDVSSLEKGTYFIKLNTEKGNTTTKFIKN